MIAQTVLTSILIDRDLLGSRRRGTHGGDERGEGRGFSRPERRQSVHPSEMGGGAGVKKNSISTVLRRLRERDLVQHKSDYWVIGDEEIVRDSFRFHRIMEDLDEGLGSEDVAEWREHAVGDAGERPSNAATWWSRPIRSGATRRPVGRSSSSTANVPLPRRTGHLSLPDDDEFNANMAARVCSVDTVTICDDGGEQQIP